MLIFFHVKQPCLDQTQKRCVSEIPFQNPFEAENQLDEGVLSQSASSNDALLITKSALVIKKKCPLSQAISVQCPAYDKQSDSHVLDRESETNKIYRP